MYKHILYHLSCKMTFYFLKKLRNCIRVLPSQYKISYEINLKSPPHLSYCFLYQLMPAPLFSRSKIFTKLANLKRLQASTEQSRQIHHVGYRHSQPLSLFPTSFLFFLAPFATMPTIIAWLNLASAFLH